MKKLHLGCWKRIIPGFINVDQYKAPHVHYNRDIRDLSIFEDESIELIYASHVLEYFDREEVKDVLKEWKRVLCKGGILRLAVPNFRTLVQVAMLEGVDKILGPLYGRMEINGSYIYHKTVYDFFSLKTELEMAGFGNIRKYDWRTLIHKDYDDHSMAYYPHDLESIRTKNFTNKIHLSLNVEGDKL